VSRAELVKPLRYGPFRLLLGAQLVSGIGDWLDYLALAVLVAYRWRMGPGALAAVAVTIALPWVILGPVAGVWADRLAPNRTMIACDLARAACVLCYLPLTGRSWLPVLLILLFIKTTFGALFGPAQQVAVSQAVPEGVLLPAVSLTTFVSQLSKVAGPAAGGLVVSVAGVRGAFTADAATFAASALLLAGMAAGRAVGPQQAHPPRRAACPGAASRGAASPEPSRGSFRHDLGEGVAWIIRDPSLRVAVGGMAATVFCVLTFDALAPLALRGLGLDTSMLGMAFAAVGAGAVGGALLVGQWARGIDGLWLMGAAQVLAGLLVAAIGVGVLGVIRTAAIAWLPVGLGLGVASAAIVVIHACLVQRQAPAAMVGRVTATAGAVTVALQLAAPPIGAALAAWHGVGFVFASAGAALAGLGALVVAGRRSWRPSLVGAAATRLANDSSLPRTAGIRPGAHKKGTVHG